MELNELKVKSGYKIVFASGVKEHSPLSPLTITAPQGMQVSLQQLRLAGSNSSGYYTVTVDGTNVITNQRLIHKDEDWTIEEGAFLIGDTLVGSVPALTGNSITIKRESGGSSYSYSYLFIESK